MAKERSRRQREKEKWRRRMRKGGERKRKSRRRRRRRWRRRRRREEDLDKEAIRSEVPFAAALFALGVEDGAELNALGLWSGAIRTVGSVGLEVLHWRGGGRRGKKSRRMERRVRKNRA